MFVAERLGQSLLFELEATAQIRLLPPPITPQPLPEPFTLQTVICYQPCLDSVKPRKLLTV